MNGKEGDHPLTDILLYDRDIFGREIDNLVRDLDVLGGWKSGIPRDWLWIQAGEYQRAKRSGDEERINGIRDGMTWNLQEEVGRLNETA